MGRVLGTVVALDHTSSSAGAGFAHTLHPKPSLTVQVVEVDAVNAQPLE
jgi:hypothetical protein